ncbi:hypothetical protein CEXT_724221 [Caerostris extrusa]|uniref:Uncharacterized protein n=1 Tax=Caerostris extrusa TaxID=172846 RepID=A0AAV4QFD2_CAEEX|nr:hypothetical protein CEXT_724221 [Caerostris extrusa]
MGHVEWFLWNEWAIRMGNGPINGMVQWNWNEEMNVNGAMGEWNNGMGMEQCDGNWSNGMEWNNGMEMEQWDGNGAME